MAVASQQQQAVRLPYFCHSVIDDLPMSLEAFRMYAHLARKWGNGKFGALGSYVDMGEHCFARAFPKASSETLRRKAISAVRELQELNLLHKETRQGHDGRNLANSYILHDLKVIVSSHQGGCDHTRIVRMHPPSAIAPLEDTNSEDSPLEDSLPFTLSQGAGVEETEREEKTQDKRTGSTLHPLAADRDSPELLGKEDKPTVFPPEPPAFISNQPEEIGFQPAESGQDKCSALGVVPEKICSNSSDSQPPAPTPTYQDRPKERFSRTPVQQNWEISPGVPYPAFVEWRSQHYTKQGGHWADAALANAKSEIRNNPQRAADLWSQFLEYSNTAADNALAHQAAGMTPTLPSCFADSQPATQGEVKRKLEALVGVAQVALPQGIATPSCTETVPYMAQVGALSLDGGRACDPQPVLSEASDPQLTGVQKRAQEAGEAGGESRAGVPINLDKVEQPSSAVAREHSTVALVRGCPTLSKIHIGGAGGEVRTDNLAEQSPPAPSAPCAPERALLSPSSLQYTSSQSTPTDSTQTIGTQPFGIQAAGAGIAVTKTADYNAAKAGTAGIPQTGTSTPGIQDAGSTIVSAPSDGDSLTDYQEQEQNIRRVALMIQSIIKPMPKPQPQQPEPTKHFQKMRSWLQCDEPALRNEAIAWLYRCQDVEPVEDEYGNPYDFTEIEF